MKQLNAFVAYPSSPPEVSRVLNRCKDELEKAHRVSGLQLWEENDIAGRFISTPILEHIRNSDFLIADVTVLNFNVTFEIGYAIGARKRVFLVKNDAHASDEELIREVGIFDTVGYAGYQNSVLRRFAGKE